MIPAHQAPGSFAPTLQTSKALNFCQRWQADFGVNVWSWADTVPDSVNSRSMSRGAEPAAQGALNIVTDKMTVVMRN
jgi:hypothetical protein